MVPKFIGAPIRRREDPRLVSGLGHYVDDISLVGTLHVALLRSPHAHARIQRIDASAARNASGVVMVITGEDIRGKVGMVPVATRMPDMKVPDHPVLAVGKVRYVGEPVAAVVATDKYAAGDAVEMIEVDYDPLPAVSNGETALAKDAPILHEEWNDNIAFTWSLTGGDVEGAFHDAGRVVRQRMVHQRLAPCAMETRGVLARYLPGEKELTLWSSTQIPHLLRTQLALMVGLPENRVRVIAPEVGGGFGSKLNVYAEEAIVAYLSMQLGQPVKWIEGRRENMAATIHGRDQVGDVEIAVKNDGTILGIRYTVIADIGAYYQLLTPAIP
ncbi:MAG: xanthine dehydrogenase family protein molybdopterin-binding subunit, partial [Candidatus Latescibacteria bacterium]|nr:xanthine dehydrogenase family protein molybdopterin-binding subunit [Candidatus Latescibacterota bacterium]